MTGDGRPVEREVEQVDWDQETAEKGGYETFMLKEIHEQADAVADTIVRPHGTGRRRRPRRGGRARRVDSRGRHADRRRRLRNRLPRGPDRPLRARGVGARAGRDGHRLGVPLPQSGRRAGRSGDRHLAVGRDGGHARGDAPGARARRDGARDHQHTRLAGHARRRRRALHARGSRDRRGGDEDVRLPGRGHVPAGAAAGRAARHARAGSCERASRRAQAPAALHRRDGRPRRARVAGDREDVLGRGLLLLHRPPRRPARRTRGRAEAEGDLLHLDRRLRGGRDEARTDRAARRRDAGRLRGDALAGARQARLEHPGGARARGAT